MTRLPARSALALAVFLMGAAVLPAVTLIVRSQPDGAMVTLEGKTLPAPATFEFKRRDEAYNFTVEKPGYQTEVVAYFTKQKLKELSVTLAPLQTQREVTIKANVDGAAVTIDGNPAGTTPLTKSVTFTRPDKASAWQTQVVTVGKADYQTESFVLSEDKPAPAPATLAQLRIERTFLVSTKTTDGTAIEALLTLADRELGAAPQK